MCLYYQSLKKSEETIIRQDTASKKYPHTKF